MMEVPPELKTFFIEGLNVAMFAGGLLIKMPQIVAILRTRSVTGMSEISLVTEFLACVSFCAYNQLMGHPFKTWGEMALIAVQCGLQVLLLWFLTERRISLAPRVLGTVALIAAYSALMLELLPVTLLPALGMLQTGLGALARVPQIILNFKQGHTGNQSIITWGMSMAGNTVRILTTLAAVDDLVTLGGHIIAFCLNFTLVSQILMFWHHTNEVVWGKEAKRKD